MDIISMQGNEVSHSKEIKRTFPYKQPRDGQLATIETIVKALDDCKYRNVFFSSPTGTGKSVIVAGILQYYLRYRNHTSFIICVRKYLQKRYRDDFGLPLVMGRNNYTCPEEVCKACPVEQFCKNKAYGCTCDIGPCDMFPIPHKGNKLPQDKQDMVIASKTMEKLLTGKAEGNLLQFSCPVMCPYMQARKNVIASPISVIGSRYMLIDTMYLHKLGRREICVFDEAHSLFSEILSMLSSTIHTEEVPPCIQFGFPFPSSDTVEEWVQYLMDIHEKVKTITDSMSVKDEDNFIRWKKLVRLKIKTKKLCDTMLIDKDRWMITKYNDTYKFEPVWIDKYTNAIFDEISMQRIFVSATIPDADEMARELGIDTNDSVWVRIENYPFPVQNRLTYVTMTGNLTYRKMGTELPKVIERIQGIVNSNPDKRIIILPYTHHLANEIYTNVSTPRQIDTSVYRDSIVEWIKGNNDVEWVYTYMDNILAQLSKQRSIMGPDGYRRMEVAIKCYETVPDSVLVTTYLNSGYDGAYDKCKVLVIPKIPYEDMSNPMMAQRMKDNPHYYIVNTVSTLLQMSGRNCRAVDDYDNKIYVLDKQFGRIYRNHKELLPKWFRDSLVWDRESD